MVTKTLEGVDLQPLYVAENWPWSGDPSGFPGFFPYARGTNAIERTRTGWDIRQEFLEPDPKSANYEILHDLSRGVTSVVVRLDRAARSGVAPSQATVFVGIDGVIAHDLTALEEVFEGVDLAKVPVALDAGLHSCRLCLRLGRCEEGDGPQVLEPVRQGVGQLKVGGGPGFLHVVTRDRDAS